MFRSSAAAAASSREDGVRHHNNHLVKDTRGGGGQALQAAAQSVQQYLHQAHQARAHGQELIDVNASAAAIESLERCACHICLSPLKSVSLCVRVCVCCLFERS